MFGLQAIRATTTLQGAIQQQTPRVLGGLQQAVNSILTSAPLPAFSRFGARKVSYLGIAFRQPGATRAGVGTFCPSIRGFSTVAKQTGELSATILGMGAYIPPEVRTNDFWPKELVAQWGEKHFVTLQKDREQKAEYMHPYLLEELAKTKGDPFAGMNERRVSKIPPSEMEFSACKEALNDAKLTPSDIDLLIAFSLPPDRIFPPNVYKLHHELGLKNAMCFEMNAICHSFLMMTDTAAQFIKSGRIKNALISVSTKYSSIMDYSSSISIAAGDGAAAAVLGPCTGDKGIQLFHHGFETSFYNSMIVRRRPPLRTTVPSFDFEGNQSSEKTFFTINEPLKAKQIISKIPVWGSSFRNIVFDSKDMYSPNDITLMVTNAAMSWYNPVLAKIFEIPIEKTEDNILNFSNMGAVNLPMNLYTAYKKGRIKNDDLVLFFGHGGGASYGGSILRWYQPNKG